MVCGGLVACLCIEFSLFESVCACLCLFVLSVYFTLTLFYGWYKGYVLNLHKNPIVAIKCCLPHEIGRRKQLQKITPHMMWCVRSSCIWITIKNECKMYSTNRRLKETRQRDTSLTPFFSKVNNILSIFFIFKATIV